MEAQGLSAAVEEQERETERESEAVEREAGQDPRAACDGDRQGRRLAIDWPRSSCGIFDGVIFLSLSSSTRAPNLPARRSLTAAWDCRTVTDASVVVR